MKEYEKIRREIEEIDRKISDLYQERVGLTEKLTEYWGWREPTASRRFWNILEGA